LCLALTAPPARAQVCTAPSFGGAIVTNSGGTEPRDIAVADFDHKDYLDIAVREDASDTVSILISSPTGFTLGATLPYASSGGLAVADFDHDGWPDIVVSGVNHDVIFVNTSDGTGGFNATTAFNVGKGPTALVAGEFTSDGHLDVAVFNDIDGTIDVMRGDGTGSFSSVSTFNMPARTQMATADVDHDGDLDLISTDGVGAIFVALGKGDGTFPNVNAFGGGGSQPTGLTVLDFNKDGALDVVTVNEASRDIELFRGDGAGNFGSQDQIGIGGGTYQRVASGDFNLDGILDLAVTDKASKDVNILLGDCCGGFRSPVVVNGGAANFDVAVADFTRDGRDDAALTLLADRAVALLPNLFGISCPAPSFAQLGTVSGVGPLPLSIAPGDYDRDGSLDFVSASQSAGSLTRWLGRGTGAFAVPQLTATGGAPVSLATGDFDRDLDLDLAVAGADLFIHTNTGGTLGPPAGLGIPSPRQVVAADVSFDGRIDLVTISAGRVNVSLNDGLGGFPATAYATTQDPVSVAVGDFDGDGKPDIAVAELGPPNVIEMFRNNGDGTFAFAGVPVNLGLVPFSIEAANMDGGPLDLVVAAGVRLRTYRGTGAFGFLQVADVPLPGNAGGVHGLDVTDFDGNGTMDVVVAAVGSQRVMVLLGNGGGGFSSIRTEMTRLEPTAVGTGDFDRDGFPDILVGQAAGIGQVLALMGDGKGTFSPRFLDAKADSRGVAAGDFDNDGKLDLAVANAGDPTVSVFLRTAPGGDFTSAIPVAAGSPTNWVTIDDFNNDGSLDIVASAEGTRQLIFIAGNGSGGFSVPIATTIAGNPYINRAADFDFDGTLDVAVLIGSDAVMYRGNGVGGFVLPAMQTIPLGGPARGLVVADFDRDGLIDVAGSQIADHAVRVNWATGPGTWGPVTQVNPGRVPLDFDAADFDGDGFLDLVIPVHDDDTIAVALYRAPRNYGLQPAASGLDGNAVARAMDMNRDGHQDVVVAGRNDHLLGFMLGDGTGKLSGVSVGTAGIRIPTYMTLGDFDNDMKLDVAVVPDTSPPIQSPPGIAVVINTNCEAREFRPLQDVSTCDLPGQPFASQPRLELTDDGANLIQCESNPVLAGIRPGTGTAGAVLLGNTSIVPNAAIVSYTDLAVDIGGGGYQLQFLHDAPVPEPEARRFLSRTFSQALAVTITGVQQFCEGLQGLYDAGPGFDLYDWRLDANPISMAQKVDLAPLLVPAGLHDLVVNATRDTCVASDLMTLDVILNLSVVNVNPPGPHSVCATCTGPTLTASPTGGGAITYQWGYRVLPGPGPFVPFAGETGPTYLIEGQDFAGPGDYVVEVQATPTCGSPASNSVDVTVTPAGATQPLSALTALSTDKRNFLEWAIPTGAPCTGVRILRRDDATPPDPNDTTTNFWVNGSDFACPADDTDSFPDTVNLLNDTKYYYSGFIKVGASSFSPIRTVTARPFDHTAGKVKWAFHTGATAMGHVGIRVQAGSGALYVLSNDSKVYVLHGGTTGGTWFASSKPYPLGLPSQSRPPVVPFAVGAAPNGAAFVTSPDGSIYTLDAETLATVWTTAVTAANGLNGAASGIFFGFGGPVNQVFAGTRAGGGDGILALDPDTGILSPGWPFDNNVTQGGNGTPIGIILGSVSVDYPDKRIFVGSWDGGGSSTIWSVDVSGASPSLLSAANVGDVDGSPILLGGASKRIVVGSRQAGVDQVHLLEADDLTSSLWPAPWPTGDGGVKGFVFPHQHGLTQFFMFSTVSRVTSIKHAGDGLNPTLNWQIGSPEIISPSIPLFLPGTTDALVGGGGGKLLRISGVDTTSPTRVFIILGDGSAAVGPSSFDIPNSMAYMGAEDGTIYGVLYPFP
jgi:hypothetical protein